MASRSRRILPALAALAAFPGLARAHEVAGTRFEAPLPLDLLFVGAGATVGLTAVGLAVANPTRIGSTAERRLGTVPPTAARVLRISARGLFALGFALALLDGLLGRQIAAENLATAFVWPVWIEGVAVVAVLVGDPWPVLSPWRTIYDGLTRLEGRPVALRAYPSWLGEWPALVGFLGLLGIVGNLTVVPTSPRATAVAVAGYALVMVLGAVVFGQEWLRRADAFAVLYRLLGRVAPLRATRQPDGEYALAVVPPWRGTTASAASFAVVGFVVAAVYTVSFDGFTSTPEYQALLFGVRDAAGLGVVALYLAGLALFVAAYLLVAALTAHLHGPDAPATARAFGLTIVPIAAAYQVAHNYPFVVGNLARVLALAGESVGVPLELPLLAWLSLPLFWVSQVVLIVGGHLVAVVAAHLVAAERGTARVALVPFTFLMVGYTVLSLWIVSRPVVS